MNTLFAEDTAAEIGAKLLGAPTWETFQAGTGEYDRLAGYRRRAEYDRPGDFTRMDYAEFCRAFVEAHAALKGDNDYRREVIGKGTLRRVREHEGCRWQGSAPRWVVWAETESGRVRCALDRTGTGGGGAYVYTNWAGKLFEGWDDEGQHRLLTR